MPYYPDGSIVDKSVVRIVCVIGDSCYDVSQWYC
jgi:hypothetical protein